MHFGMVPSSDCKDTRIDFTYKHFRSSIKTQSRKFHWSFSQNI